MLEHIFHTPIGEPFIELQSIDSTNKYAINLAHNGLVQNGTVFFAHNQYAGKGQRGKLWTTEAGKNLTLSIVLNPYPLKLADSFKLSYCVAVAVSDFFKNYCGNETKIKWPNDIYWNDRKAGGILIENVVGCGASDVANWQWAVVGIGININQTVFPDDLINPVSLKQITGKEFDVLRLAKELCTHLEKYYSQLIADTSNSVFDQYLDSLYKKNEKVKLKKMNRIFEVTIKGVSKNGQLITQHAIEEVFEFGEVEWLIDKTDVDS